MPRPDYVLVLERCLRRIRRWPMPPNWSRPDWLEEASACGALAACQADRDFDPLRGIPFEGFVYARVMAAALTRYRQEWSYAGHCLRRESHRLDRGELADATERLHDTADAYETLGRLAEQDRWLLEQAFWHQATEANIARHLGISQQAVSKRKAALLTSLRAQVRQC